MRRENRIDKRWIIPGLAVLVLAAVLAAVMLDGGEPSGGNPAGQTRPPSLAQTVQTDPADTTESAEQTDGSGPDQSIPADATLPAEDDSPQTDPAGTQPPQTQPPKQSGREDIVCREFARFSGQYVEDGRDELVENVAAILVTNQSDQFLDLATLTYDVDGETATFVVTGLPAGRSAWVMEAERLVIPDDAEFTLLDCVTAFRSGVTVETEAVSIYADANMLTAVNNTGQTLEGVFVYYKTLHTDGNFFGGITYRVDFGTLEPGGSAQVLAGHYSAENSELVRIGWVDQ